MKTTIAAESVTAMEITSAAESSAMEVTPTMKIALAMEIAELATITESSIIVAAEVTIAGPVISAVEAAEPRTRADKNAVVEVVGTVITVRRAIVWVISVISVGAVGRGTDVSRGRDVTGTNSNAYAKSNLGIGSRAHENYEKPEQTEIF